MQRPRNHQNRGSQQDGRGRGRGRQRGRHGFSHQSNHPAPLSHVPNINQVKTGAPVSIVLKVDQPTGREVQGTVADVLTNGNHPRGIKVRLADGRVGRVQRMFNEQEADAGSAGLSNLSRSGETNTSQTPSRRFDHRYHDVRKDEESSRPPSGYDLDAFLPANHPLRNEDTTTESKTRDAKLTTQLCPVCGEFEGDETAVSHHVNSHFA
jgi:uncharacterized repeat protein (TIGR03833 family)